MSKQRISRTQKQIRSQLLKHQLGTIVPRGISIPVDKFMAGDQRFARPIGSSFPILTPRNTMRLSSPIKQGEVTVSVDELLPDVPINSIVSFTGGELQFVETTDYNNNLIRISSNDGFLSGYGINTSLYLYAVPCTVEVGVLKGATNITISLDFVMVHGDVLTEVLVEGSGGSAVDIPTTDVVPIQETGPYIYNITLSSGLLKKYSIGDTIYLRAYPGYKSVLIPLPTQLGTFGNNIGPFLWDFINSRMHDGVINDNTGEPDPEAFMALTTYSPAFDMQGPMRVRGKNSVHVSATIPSHFFALWDKHQGTLLYEGSLTTITVDEYGEFLISSRLVPEWPASINSWYIGFMATANADVRIGFHLVENPGPNPIVPVAPPGASYIWEEELQMMFFDFSVIGGASSTTSIKVEAPSYDFDRIVIGGNSNTDGCKVTIRDWNPLGGISTWVQYSVMGRVTGEYAWGCSGLILKPIFMNRDNMQQTDQIDTGLVMF